MKFIISLAIVLIYPLLAFTTYRVIKYYRKHEMFSLDMLPDFSFESLQFSYLVFTVPAIVIGIYFFFYKQIYLLGDLYRLIFTALLVPVVFLLFYGSHKIFYYFESVSLDELFVKICTTTIPLAFIVGLICLFGKYLANYSG